MPSICQDKKQSSQTITQQMTHQQTEKKSNCFHLYFRLLQSLIKAHTNCTSQPMIIPMMHRAKWPRGKSNNNITLAANKRVKINRETCIRNAGEIRASVSPNGNCKSVNITVLFENGFAAFINVRIMHIFVSSLPKLSIKCASSMLKINLSFDWRMMLSAANF